MKAASHYPPARTPPLVLLVDPDADTRALYRMALQAARYEVVEAEDGRQALATIFDCHPSFIVTETRLPFVDGFELCTLLRSDEQTRAMYIVVLSGDAYPAQIERALSVGADSVLVKPCPPEMLIEEVQRINVQAYLGKRRNTAKSRIRSHKANRPAARTFERFDTTDPPLAPPSLPCPSCDRSLQYTHSQIGGVNERHREQWDYFVCRWCGMFQYRQRTRKIRHIDVVHVNRKD